MHEELRARLQEITQRAGVRNVPPKTLAAGVAVCAVIVAVALWNLWPSRAAPDRLTLDPQAAAGTPQAAPSAEASPSVASASQGTTSGAVYVHVVGAVRTPGLYRLAPGARVAEAILAADGLLGSAEERAVNLAREVADGEQIVVPTQDEFAKSGGEAVESGSSASAAGSGGAGPSVGPIDINTADAAALDALPGIGPSTAAKIVADREANGPFSSPEDLGRVSGIGPKKLETLLGLIVAR